MRPLELKLRNFRSYAGEHSFDFRDRTLVGIVGPIGSGKSSVLDGIAFALYGRTPRIGSATKTLINQRSADMSVVLRFVVEEEIWEAARSIRIKGQSQHALYRYEDDSQEAAPVEKLTMEGEVTNALTNCSDLTSLPSNAPFYWRKDASLSSSRHDPRIETRCLRVSLATIGLIA